MAKISIDCDIRSNDSKSIFQTEGIWNNNVMTFQDPQQDTHILTVSDNTILYQKQGQASMTFLFDPSTITTGTYQVMGQVLEFQIKTIQCHHTNGLIRIEYQLLQENELVGHTTLSIDYRYKEE
jgi:uncharacterized beta-barrel protein YwiB (DUF1934 family)